MTNDGLLPSEEQLDEFFSNENSEELEEEVVEETPETEEETVTLSQEEYDTLKKGQMLQSDYTRKRQEESQRVRELQQQLEDARRFSDNSIKEETAELSADLDDSDLPDSVKSRVSEIDKIKRELETEKEERKRVEIKRRADEIIHNLKEVEGDYPIIKNKAVKFAVMAYASQVLNNSSLQGFKDAAKEITGAFKDEYSSKQAKIKKQVTKSRATSPSIGSGGSAPIRTVEAPKSFGEANELVMDALAKMNALDGR